MHTSYFNWLKKTFDFETIPDIIHCIAYHHSPYLKSPIELYLQKRYKIKQQLLKRPDVSLKIQSEIIKLLMNRLATKKKLLLLNFSSSISSPIILGSCKKKKVFSGW